MLLVGGYESVSRAKRKSLLKFSTEKNVWIISLVMHCWPITENNFSRITMGPQMITQAYFYCLRIKFPTAQNSCYTGLSGWFFFV